MGGVPTGGVPTKEKTFEEYLKDTPSKELCIKLIRRAGISAEITRANSLTVPDALVGMLNVFEIKKQPTQENDMAKKEPNEEGVNRHKRMAMGKEVELKKGGKAEKKAERKEEKKEHKKRK